MSKNSGLLILDSTRYNISMVKKKWNLYRNKYCLWILGVFIFTGCSLKSKRSDLLGLQQIRIKKLEQQLAVKNETIAKMKMQKWVQAPPPKPISYAIRPLQRLLKEKKWVQALKLSSKMKTDYPNSKRLARYRVVIFRKMGLNKQATQELKRFKRLISKQKRSNKTI
jgi:hypothetical protein